MSAANEYRQQDACLDSQSYRERAWGSLFAQTVIQSSTFANGVAMQPENPNENQVATFNAYTRSIINVCRTEVIKKILAPHPSNTDETVTAQIGPTGGLPRLERLKEDMTKAMIAKDVPKMAEIFRQTCPGDWERGYGPALGVMLRNVVEDGLLPPEKTYREIDVKQYVIFNWELAEVADLLVDTFELPKPDGKPCILWDDREWFHLMCRETSGFRGRYERVLAHWWMVGFVPRPLWDQGPKSPRFGKYLAAAVAMSSLPQPEVDAVLEDMTRWMKRLKEFWTLKCAENEGVLLKRREWQKEIGL